VNLDEEVPPTPNEPDWHDIVNATNSFRATQLLFTYIFTGLVLRFLYRNYRRFVRARQLYSLELVHSIAGRTVMITDLPPHLRGERNLAIYFENMDLQVESVNVVRQANDLKVLIEKRTEALLRLEREWTRYVGNPSTVEDYDHSQNVRSDTAPLVDIGGTDAEAQPVRVVVPHRPRPTIRPGWFKRKVDALEYYEKQFQELDEQVRKRRKTGKFRSTQTAFVTFEKMSDAVSIISSSSVCLTDRFRSKSLPKSSMPRTSTRPQRA
jgi:calcium permeable stress-gated cation channel